jgi:hypothetical protein
MGDLSSLQEFADNLRGDDYRQKCLELGDYLDNVDGFFSVLRWLYGPQVGEGKVRGPLR